MPRKLEQLTFAGLSWSGEIPRQKWMNFYTQVLVKFAVYLGLKLKLDVEIIPDGGISKQRLEEIKAALREVGLDENHMVTGKNIKAPVYAKTMLMFL